MAVNTEDKAKITNLEAELARLKSAASTSSTAETSSSPDVAALEERLRALEQENSKLSNDLTVKIGEFEESLEGQISAMAAGSQPRTSVSLSASSVMSTGSLPDSNASSVSTAASASAPKRLAFDSPVRYQNPPTVTTSADTISGSSVEPAFPSTQTSSTPSVDESHSTAEAVEDPTPTMQAVPSSPITYSLATSSAARISPGQSLFGKSAPVAATVSTSSANSSSEGNNACGSVVTEAEQSSQSRDSGSGMPVSSSDGRRKRSATNESSSCESKRHRDSPSEVVTSSEERRDLDVNPESGMAAAADMEVMDVPDEAEGDDDIEVLEEGQEDSVQHEIIVFPVELLSDEDVSEQSMDDFDEDEG
ncbi:unnamed protein product [Nippostrongylus brasiliensis]|uniref:CAP-Gly domain-containing protein n=1 Tax=Nippostrongylus brasiliensis TaxID=27835 RepID=A0A0N4Y881_NIPBR|nr:unnamed protein product [Nippostrongylus brasiliensis]